MSSRLVCFVLPVALTLPAGCGGDEVDCFAVWLETTVQVDAAVDPTAFTELFVTLSFDAAPNYTFSRYDLAGISFPVSDRAYGPRLCPEPPTLTVNALAWLSDDPQATQPAGQEPVAGAPLDYASCGARTFCPDQPLVVTNP